MRVHSIIDQTTVNGPGRRLAVWTQGCTLKCPGCWNPDTHDHAGAAAEISPRNLAKRILSTPDIEGVTFSGGDPIQQITQLLFTLFLVKQQLPSFSVGLYTGYTQHELEEGRFEHMVNGVMMPGLPFHWRQLKKYLDFAVMGRYNATKATTVLPMCGSFNQELVLFSERYLPSDFGRQMVELLIAPDGKSITMTGFPVGIHEQVVDKLTT
jgi:anaerobic ribonucleoside-triphosphate reductase activating protein